MFMDKMTKYPKDVNSSPKMIYNPAQLQSKF